MKTSHLMKIKMIAIRQSRQKIKKRITTNVMGNKPVMLKAIKNKKIIELR